jgi:hypothetical protein
MTRPPPGSIRLRIALLAVLLYAGISTARWVRRAAAWPSRPGADEISRYERRFDALRTALPAQGTVGYLGHPNPDDPEPPDGDSPALLHFRRYLLAQYSLAPLLLIESTDPEFVIGNFDPGAVLKPPAGFQNVGEFGDGLVLFRRVTP